MSVRVWDVSRGVSKAALVEELPHMTKPNQDKSDKQHITAVCWEVRSAICPLTYSAIARPATW